MSAASAKRTQKRIRRQYIFFHDIIFGPNPGMDHSAILLRRRQREETRWRWNAYDHGQPCRRYIHQNRATDRMAANGTVGDGKGSVSNGGGIRAVHRRPQSVEDATLKEGGAKTQCHS